MSSNFSIGAQFNLVCGSCRPVEDLFSKFMQNISPVSYMARILSRLKQHRLLHLAVDENTGIETGDQR